MPGFPLVGLSDVNEQGAPWDLPSLNQQVLSPEHPTSLVTPFDATLRGQPVDVAATLSRHGDLRVYRP